MSDLNKSKPVSSNSPQQSDIPSNNENKNLAKNTTLNAVHNASIISKLAQILNIAKFVTYLQALAALAVTAITALVSLVVTSVVAVVSGIVHGIVSAVTSIATMLGTSIAAAAVVAATTTVVLATAVGGMIYTAVTNNVNTLLKFSDTKNDCSVEVINAVNKEVNADEQYMINAHGIYSILSAAGLPDVNIAGILSNFAAESPMDQTGIETIFDENYTIGPRKEKALKDYDYFTRNTVFGAYANSGVPINKDAYLGTDGKYYAGCSFGGYTGENCRKFFDAADKVNNGEWYQLEFSIAYMFVYPAQGVFSNGIGSWTEPESNPVDAATYFCLYWEGNPYFLAEHTREADKWYNEIQNWEVDSEVANTALNLADQLGRVADSNEVGRALDDCIKYKDYDNSTIAKAAVSYAYATESEGENNNGTALYQKVHDTVYPNDPFYMSCDRGVACAVKWSGADVEYPAGGTGNQLSYLLTSDKWTEINFNSYGDYDKLQAGDVFCCEGHTFVYVSNDIISDVHGDKALDGSDIVSASFNERSPGCGFLRYSYSPYDTRPYRVFRCTKPDNSDTYSDAGADAKGEEIISIDKKP